MIIGKDRERVRTLIHLFQELSEHVHENAGFLNARRTFESNGNDPMIHAHWATFNKVCNKFLKLRLKIKI